MIQALLYRIGGLGLPFNSVWCGKFVRERVNLLPICMLYRSSPYRKKMLQCGLDLRRYGEREHVHTSVVSIFIMCLLMMHQRPLGEETFPTLTARVLLPRLSKTLTLDCGDVPSLTGDVNCMRSDTECRRSELTLEADDEG